MGDKKPARGNGPLFVLACFMLLAASPAPLFSQSTDSPDHAYVYRANAALASTEPKAERSSAVPRMIPTADQPFYWAWFALSPASPSVGDHLSNLHPPVFFWAWGESHVPSIAAEYPPPCGSEKDRVEMTAFGDARLEGASVWLLEGEQVTKPLNRDSANPLQNQLSPAAWSHATVREGEGRAPLLSPFSIQFSGRVLVLYQRVELRHYLHKSKDSFGNTVEKCESKDSSRLMDYSLDVASAQSYQVENGGLLSLKVSPADREQLSLGSALRRVDITARRPFQTMVRANQSLINTARYADYAYLRDEAGFLYLNRTDREATLSSNFSALFLHPTALDAQNRSYAYQYQSHLVYPFALGLSNVSVQWQDDFQDQWNASWILLVRSGGAISGSNPETVAAVLLDPRAPPAMPERKTNGPLPSIHLAPTDYARGADAYFPPSFSLPLVLGGLLLAPLAFYLFLLLSRRPSG